MPQYTYQARNGSGSVEAGGLAAADAATAAAMLRGKGLHVVQLAPTATQDRFSGLSEKLSWSSGPGKKEILDFTTQLAVMIRAGISIRQALEGIADQTTNVKFKRILLEIKSDIESGRQFSEAISKHPKLFGQLYISMVKASEMSGAFARMLDRIAAYLQQELETRKMVVGASIYPGIIATMAIGVTVFLLTFVLPRFAGVFEGKEEALPGPTKFLMSLSDFMVGFWWVILIAAAAAITGFVLFIKTELGGFWWDRSKLSMPVANRMFRALYISRSLHTMGELLNAGVPMLDTLAITGDISGNRLFKKMWRSVHASVRQGRKIQTQLSKSRLLPKSVVQMVAAGEDSGKLGEVLDEVSDYYHRVLREAIKAVTSMIEPLMIVIMGSVVGFIAMAIILPIFKMSSLVSG
ncbi:MAG: type II secretion system F family protein [Phycisphaeraceae bacterium]|nr:type II secretion system F family protein [Phycisphaeraceae bacterium]MDG1359624.1 type II secretion system F family protein [Phycisphaerales bacterium]MCP4068274.1 type II secretion system F family protein [Phycisphaeraceae bacterium]MCP4496119.1 type II secretion system F family protein [Phycisphaeraceae bacterium]MCP4795938.1 type II secretion system F family protein [Phycisphaeraceae bacterium]